MDEQQFLRVLDLFPRVRSASYCEEEEGSDASKQAKASEAQVSTSEGPQLEDSLCDHENHHEDVFWPRLRAAVEKKLSPENATRFCDAFRQVHESLVHAALTSKTIDKALKTWEQRCS